ncbi:hypothetical protein NM208_g2272 [Fusarium decemcellulare]|uniref:Uncharacterized protein n=1 Tax=Fusarium decemcellulare TaxID=57161 RepID=A0ACC1ST78_9HYPO|nr:hypothetical protein NM208_g2272 [Fusarium decemcellulare]
MDQISTCTRSTQVPCDGLLIDMDGTIIDSTMAVEKNWRLQVIGDEIGVSHDVILQTSHGRRSMDVFKDLAPEKANWEYITSIEERLPRLFSKEVTEILGARDLLLSVVRNKIPWAIVTSGSAPLVLGWLEAFGLPKPEHLVTAESVAEGKPDPECYLLGRKHLGLNKPCHNVIVLEDSPAGIYAGKLAGCKVLGLVTSHTLDQIVQAKPDWIVKDLDSIKLARDDQDNLVVEISDMPAV